MTTLVRKAARSRPSTAGLFDPLVIDNFAGLGGASFGIKLGTNGRSVDVCVNHCPRAIEYHSLNHPETRHIKSDVWEVDPVEACGGDTIVHIRPSRREADHVPGRRRRSTRQIRKLMKHAGRAVALAWFSPDCRHFSPARGSAPVSPRVRSLAWIVVKYARTVKPETMMVENVRAFLDWGPVRQRKHANGRPVFDGAGRPVMEPIPEKKGQTFKRWARLLKREGYKVEWRVLDAAEYGVPQHRRRLFVILKRTGKPIVWPEATHGPGRLPYRTAADIMDWSIAPTSIFDRPRELADNTQGRIFEGFMRFVVDDPDPFILRIGQQGGNGSYVSSIDDPIGATVTKAEHCVVAPTMMEVNHSGPEHRGRRVDATMPTVTGGYGQALSGMHIVRVAHGEKSAKGGRRGRGAQSLREPNPAVTGSNDAALGGAYIAQLGYGERQGQRPRAMSIKKSLGTVVGSQKHAATVPVMIGVGGAGYSAKPTRLDRPANTTLPHDRRAVVMPWMERLCGGPGGNKAKGRKLTKPTGAITTRDQHSLGGAWVCGVGGRAGQSPARSLKRPGGVVTTKADAVVSVAHMTHFNHGEVQWSRPDQPSRTLTTANHQGIVETELSPLEVNAPQGADARKITLTLAFLMKFYSTGGQWGRLDNPLGTVTTADRFAIVTVRLQTGATVDAAAVFTRAFGWCVVLDILMRMLTPRELARAQGFPDSYILPKNKTLAVKLIGNSVPPPVVAALTRANCPELCA